MELVHLEVGLFYVSCRFRNVENGFLWSFFGVYGPVLSNLREDFWDELGAIRELWGEGALVVLEGTLMLSGLLVSVVRVVGYLPQ